MQSRSFSQLLLEGFRQYRRSLSTNLALSALYLGLPSLLVVLAGYLWTAPLWAELSSVLRQAAGLGSLNPSNLLYAFGAAMTDFFSTQGFLQSSSQAAMFSLGVILLALALGIGYTFVLAPLMDLRLLYVAAEGWHGRRCSLGQALRSAQGHRWQAIVAMLCQMVLTQAAGGLVGVLFALLMLPLLSGLLLPRIGAGLLLGLYALMWLICVALGLLCVLLYFGALLGAQREGRWGFVAMWRGIVLVRRRLGGLLGGLALLSLGQIVLQLLCLTLDLAGLLFLGTPPLLCICAAVFCWPLSHSFYAMVYFDRLVVEGGYRPLPTDRAFAGDQALPPQEEAQPPQDETQPPRDEA